MMVRSNVYRIGVRKRPRHLEDSIQMTVISYLQLVRYGGKRVSDIAYHIPNGGKRNAMEGRRFKLMGVRSGVPDLHLPVAVGPYHGAYWELKSEDGRQTASQKDFALMCYENKYYYSLNRDAVDCVKDIIAYLRNGDRELKAPDL